MALLNQPEAFIITHQPHHAETPHLPCCQGKPGPDHRSEALKTNELFVVGAGHLDGEHDVVELLRKKGYLISGNQLVKKQELASQKQ